MASQLDPAGTGLIFYTENLKCCSQSEVRISLKQTSDMTETRPRIQELSSVQLLMPYTKKEKYKIDHTSSQFLYLEDSHKL